MRKWINATLVCLCLGLAFSGAAQAASQHKQAKQQAKQKVAIYLFDSYSQSFADLLGPGLSLGKDFSPLFGKKPGVAWTINSVFLFLPYHVQPGSANGFTFYGNDQDGNYAWSGFGANPITVSVFSSSHFVPSVLLVFYQEQISAVPEASAGVMMALGLPVVGWLAWRRRSGAGQTKAA